MNIRPVILFSAILTVLSLYYFLFETDANRNRTIKGENIKTVFHFETSNIEEIKLTSKTNRIIIIKKDNEWVLTEPVKKKARTKSVNEFLLTCSKIIKIMPITDDPEKKIIFGLAPPSIEISLQQKDGKAPLSILIGDYNPNMTCVYAKTKTSPNIFLIGSLFKNDLDREVDFFVQKTEDN